LVSNYVSQMVDMAERITLDHYLASFEVMAEMHDALLQDVFKRHDALICPTLADNRWPAEGSATAHDDLMRCGMTYPFNMLSRHPVLAVPSGFASHGVPTGLQIVAHLRGAACDADRRRAGTGAGLAAMAADACRSAGMSSGTLHRSLGFIDLAVQATFARAPGKRRLWKHVLVPLAGLVVVAATFTGMHRAALAVGLAWLLSGHAYGSWLRRRAVTAEAA